MYHGKENTARDIEKGRSIWISSQLDIEGYVVYDHIKKTQSCMQSTLRRMTQTQTQTRTLT